MRRGFSLNDAGKVGGTTPESEGTEAEPTLAESGYGFRGMTTSDSWALARPLAPQMGSGGAPRCIRAKVVNRACTLALINCSTLR